MKQRLALSVLAAVIAASLACAHNSDPLSPTDGTGSTLNGKLPAPTTVSPVNDQQPAVLTLTASMADGAYGTAASLRR